MKFRWLGHSAIELEDRGKKIVVDPFTEEPLESDIICLTHGHSDHIGSTIDLAKKYKKHNPRVIAIFELASYLQSKGIDVIGMNIGGSIIIDGIEITMVEARHSSSIMEEGKIIYAGEPCGYVIKGSRTVYHAGDTSLFSDMRLIKELYAPDISFLPVGGFYTMNERQAVMAAELIGSYKIVPIHYNTFDLIKTDLKLLKEKLGEMLFVPEKGKAYEI
jgi:L-ascorbate metabolism protein UlaG (beta-lactamase superfamily)